MDLKDKKICFLGDSITAGSGVSCQENRYTDVFSRITSVGEVKNYGIGGTRIAKQIVFGSHNPFVDDKSFCERFDLMDNDADIVVVFGGTNDFGHGDAPFGCEADREMTTFCGACHYLMNGLINKYPEATIVFMTPIHRQWEQHPFHDGGLILKAYVDVIKWTAEFYAIPVLDLYSISGIYPDNELSRKVWCPDGLHPNDKGAERIARLLKNFLENVL